jgi:predicted RNA polymerase sigma factor
VALAMVEGPEAGILAVEKISNLPPMKSYYLLPATLAEFYVQMKDFGKAAERKFLRRKLEASELATV